jgi:hypothetical protein
MSFQGKTRDVAPKNVYSAFKPMTPQGKLLTVEEKKINGGMGHRMSEKMLNTEAERTLRSNRSEGTDCFFRQPQSSSRRFKKTSQRIGYPSSGSTNRTRRRCKSQLASISSAAPRVAGQTPASDSNTAQSPVPLRRTSLSRRGPAFSASVSSVVAATPVSASPPRCSRAAAARVKRAGHVTDSHNSDRAK